MRMKFAIAAAAVLLAATACEKDNGGSGGGSDFNVVEVMKQARSTKRGLSGSFQLPDTDIKLVAPGVGWYYTWSNNVPSGALLDEGLRHGVDFVPMIWNNNYSAANIAEYARLNPSSHNKYVLAYNEPNLTDQANMTPAQAAEHWDGVRQAAAGAGWQLVSPALNYGTLAGYSDPVVWMDEFLAQPGVSSGDFCAVALHCYMPGATGMRDFIRRFSKYGKPVFMTEFCYANGNISNNASTQRTFMCQALNYLENDDAVAKYSWFMTRASNSWAAVSILNSSVNAPALTDLGKTYVYFSSFDRNTWYGAGEAIPAEHYVTNNASAAASSNDTMRDAPAVRPSHDGDSMLDLTDFHSTHMWVEYQIDVRESRNYDLAVRYIGDITDGLYEFFIDGNSIGQKSFAKSERYRTEWINGIALSAGKHTLRVGYIDGRTDFNWFCLK